MLDIKALKETLTLDDYEKVFDELGIPVVSRSNDVWMLKSMCHCISPDDCDANLAFYTNTYTLTCFSHGCLSGGDIFELVKIRQQLFNPDYTFFDSVIFVLDTLGLNSDNYQSKTIQSSWHKIVAKYHRNFTKNERIVYDDNILKGFPKMYYQGWIDEGICGDSLKKFLVAYYPTKDCIILPCRDIKGDLVGIRGRYFYGDNGKYRPVKLLNGTIYNFPTSVYMYGEYENSKSISQKKKAILVEGEKSVLKSDSWYGNNSIALALYGSNVSSVKIKTLLSMGVDEVTIGIDYDYQDPQDAESQEYRKKVMKTASMLKPYFRVNVMFNDRFQGYKYSPFDFTKEQFEYLYKNRVDL